MAQEVFEGFDHYNNATDLYSRSNSFLQWQQYSFFGPTISFPTGRDGFGKCLNLTSTTNGTIGILATWGARNAEGYFGQAVLVPQGVSFWITCFDGVAGAGQCYAYFNGYNYSVQFFRGAPNGGTSLYISPNNVWTPEVWSFIELHAKISSSAGLMEVRVRNEVVASVSGVNTQNTANTWFDTSNYLVSPITGVFPSLSLDDLYYNDTSTGPGTFPANTYLGDFRVSTLFAIGNDSVQWSPQPNTNANWVNIREIDMDSDTTYNYSSTVGQQDTFNYGSLENTIQTIYGIQLTGAYRKDDALARVIKQVLKTGGSSYFGSNWSVPDTAYAYFTDLFTLNPNTSANWTLAQVNALAAGYNLVS